jgi:hypothetical protein
MDHSGREYIIPSEMTGKLTGIQAINTSPLDNEYCKKMRQCKGCVCFDCFSCNMLEGSRKNCRPSWKRNGELLQKPLKVIPTIDTVKGRFSGHGELHNREHARNYFRIARKNPSVSFAFWTKRIDLVKGMRVPRNVTMVYSNPVVDEVRSCPPAGFHKVFNVVTKGSSVKSNCNGKQCRDCGICYSRKGERVIVETLKARS